MIILFLFDEGADVPWGPDWLTPAAQHCHAGNLSWLRYELAETLSLNGAAAIALNMSLTALDRALPFFASFGHPVILVGICGPDHSVSDLDKRRQTLHQFLSENFLGLVPEPFFHHAMRVASLSKDCSLQELRIRLKELTGMLLLRHQALLGVRFAAWFPMVASDSEACDVVLDYAQRPIPMLPTVGRRMLEPEPDTLPLSAAILPFLAKAEALVRRRAEELAGVALRLRRKVRVLCPDPVERLLRETRSAFRPSSKSAIIAHVHYPDLLPEFAALMRDHGADIFISLSALATPAQVETLRRDLPAAVLFRFPNVGRDVYPFLEIFRSYGLHYITVCKVHSKKSLWKNDLTSGTAWRQAMTEDLLGSPERSAQIRDAFEADPRLGLVAPTGYLAPLPRYWLANRPALRWLCQLHNVPFDEAAGFVPGTMFWARSAALTPLIGGPRFLAFGENGGVDGARAHAYERFFCMVASGYGFTSTTTDQAIRMASESRP